MSTTRAFSEALALASPNGRTSKRALKAAQGRVADELFPAGFWESLEPATEPKEVAIRRQAADLLAMAERGFRASYHRKHAAKLLASIGESI